MQTNPWDPEGAAVVLDPQGRVCAEMTGGVPDLAGYFKTLVGARALDLRLQREFERWLSAAGEEAPVVAVGLVAHPQELIFCGFRDQALAFARDGDIATTAGAWARSMSTGDTGFLLRLGIVPAGQSLGMHLAFAAGCAAAAKLHGDGRATFVSLGEGLTTTGAYYEALMNAVSNDLPLVFVCRTQLWPEAAPAEAGVIGDSVAERARSCGLWTRRVDGADPLAVYGALRNAATRAREGRGPSLVEAVVTPLHRNPPPHRDPVERLRRHLEQAGSWTSDLQQDIETELALQLDRGLNPPS